MEPRIRPMLSPLVAALMTLAVISEQSTPPRRSAPKPRPIPPETNPLDVGDMLWRGVVGESDVAEYLRAKQASLNPLTEAPPASVAMALPRGDAPDVLAAQAAAMAVPPHETRAQRRERLRAKGQ